LFEKSTHAQSAEAVMATQSSFAWRRRRLKFWQAAAWAATFAGLLLAVQSVVAPSPAVDLNVITAASAIALLALGAFYSFPQSRRLFRYRSRTAVASLEKIKDAHWELAASASRYRQLLDAQQDFVVRRSRDGHIVFANSAFCDAFDVRREDVLGSIFEPPVIAAEPETKPSPNIRRVVELLRTLKGERWIAWDACEVRSDGGESEIQRVGRDVTAEREAEAALKTALDQAEAANRAKSRFLAAMSHEIRTPMNGILGMISLMRDMPLDREQQTCARVVEDSARALLGLIDDILDFSKIEAGKLDIASKPFSLRACVAQAMQLLAPEAAAKHLSFTSTLGPAVPDWVRGDEMRVRQIILNLISNAVKFTDTGGIAVRVLSVESDRSAAAGPAKIAIEVADTGIGFSPDVMQRLFDEFEQGETAATRQPGGTGLGLAISKRLARAMGGDIIADGASGKGATFTALLAFDVADRADEDEYGATWPEGAAQNVSASAGTSGSSRNRRRVAGDFSVLVAEDNRINALLARKIIERAGGRATVVEDGRSAIAAIWEAMEHRRPVYDLILMDVLMPGLDGLMATKAIKALYAERRHLGLVSPPIIALTANAFPEDRDRCRAAGMDDYLAKPFDAQHLHDMLLRWGPQRTEEVPPAA
jgi:PAS domain S-box-containing protein